MSECNENQQVTQTDWYRFEAGTKSFANGDIELGLSTPTKQGINMYKNGNCDFAINGTLKEVSGFKVKNPDEFARIIDATNGSILIQALNGTITLKAKNIRLVGVDGTEGEITIQASKKILTNAPTVTTQGTNITLAAAQNASVAGSTTTVHGATPPDVSSGAETDNSSIMGQILDAIKRFKNFFNSICEDKPEG
jgi:hypothetical protein